MNENMNITATRMIPSLILDVIYFFIIADQSGTGEGVSSHKKINPNTNKLRKDVRMKLTRLNLGPS